MEIRGFWVNNSKNGNGNKSNHRQHPENAREMNVEMVTKKNVACNWKRKHLTSNGSGQPSKYTYNGDARSFSSYVIQRMTASDEFQRSKIVKEMSEIVNTKWKSIYSSAFLSAFDGRHLWIKEENRRGMKRLVWFICLYTSTIVYFVVHVFNSLW